ncbi:universal stress protein [Lysinimonas soli]|uniref:Universal stress protein n=1 Tax=Lysinimonas soli TaxID=1074233 RepID=A0ABW0NMZ5_9MICO
MERILIGIDADGSSEAAVAWAAHRAASGSAQIELVTVMDTLLTDTADTEALLATTASRIEQEAPGTAVNTEILELSIVGGLAIAARAADLLVIGSHPHHRLASMISGALPVRISTDVSCPTVVVPVGWKPVDGRIVVGIDIDDSSDKALIFAAREAAARGRELDVVHAWRPTPYSPDPATALVFAPEAILAAHQKILDTAAARAAVELPADRIHTHLDRGRPLDAVVAHVEGAELVVLGTHEWGPITGALFGSTVQQVMEQIPVPLAIVPMGRQEQ